MYSTREFHEVGNISERSNDTYLLMNCLHLQEKISRKDFFCYHVFFSQSWQVPAITKQNICLTAGNGILVLTKPQLFTQVVNCYKQVNRSNW